MAKKNVIQIPLQHNYCIIAPGLPWACRCDKMEGQPLPPESFPTIEETVDRLPKLFLEVANRCFPARMPMPPGAIRIPIVTLDSVMAGDIDHDDHTQPGLTRQEILDEFQKHPSVPLIGLIYFWESYWDGVSCLIQGQQEIQQYLQTPDAQELSHVAQSLGATIQTGTGIVIS